MTFNLTKFIDFSPTSMDSTVEGTEGKEDWLVMPITQNRDSLTIELSNFHVMQQIFEDSDPSQSSFSVHRYGHWGNGWYEILVFDPSNKTVNSTAETILQQLEQYIVLDEGHWLLLEMEHEDFDPNPNLSSWDDDKDDPNV